MVFPDMLGRHRSALVLTTNSVLRRDCGTSLIFIGIQGECHNEMRNWYKGVGTAVFHTYLLHLSQPSHGLPAFEALATLISHFLLYSAFL